MWAFFSPNILQAGAVKGLWMAHNAFFQAAPLFCRQPSVQTPHVLGVPQITYQSQTHSCHSTTFHLSETGFGVLQHITCLGLQLLMFYNLLAVQAHVLHVLQPITGIAQWYRVGNSWLKEKVKRSSPSRSGRKQENFLLQGQPSVLTLISLSVRPCVTTVAHKRSQLFCQKCRWQVTAKHTYALHVTLNKVTP